MDKDFKAIFEALKAQGWVRYSVSGGHYKLRPPQKNLPMVCIATTSSDPRAIKNVLRDLRASGFVWPPPEAKKMPLRSVPDKEPDMGEVLPLRQEKTDVPNVDDLFFRLKEARSYASLAKEARDEAKIARDKAESALVGSEKELEIAVAQLKKAKDDFDKAFEE